MWGTRQRIHQAKRASNAAQCVVRRRAERALRPEQLKAEIGRRFPCPVDSCDSVREGIKLALKTAAEAATDRPVILAFGSLYQVGEILAIYESM